MRVSADPSIQVFEKLLHPVMIIIMIRKKKSRSIRELYSLLLVITLGNLGDFDAYVTFAPALMEDNDVRERMRTPGPIQCDQKSAQYVI